LLCHSKGYNTYKIALLKVLYQLAHDTYSGVQGHFGVIEKGWDRWLVMWLTCLRRTRENKQMIYDVFTQQILIKFRLKVRQMIISLCVSTLVVPSVCIETNKLSRSRWVAALKLPLYERM
jgi:hypothetical protein